MGVGVSIIPDVIEGTSKISGKGAFAGRHYNSGDVIFDWSDYCVVHKDDPLMDEKALQVAPDLFMPKYPGCVDDMVNHSCDPNAAVVIRDGKVQLKAIRPINAMAEITFDYSITMLDDEWAMKCQCGSKKCRDVILEYRQLPADIRKQYEYMKIVPDYVILSNGRAG